MLSVGFGRSAEPERTDEELATEDINGELVIVFPIIVWSRIRLERLEHAVLVAAEYGGLVAITALLGSARLAAAGP